MRPSRNELLPNERIIGRIIILRGERVILDTHLAELYKVENRALKQAVRRNKDRFPDDFMFILSDEEIEQVVSQNVIPSRSHLGGAAPFAFTESGVAMLSSILQSKQAIEVNIQVMRTFVAIRKMAIHYDEIMKKIEELEMANESQFKEIHQILNYLLHPVREPRQIGFKKDRQS